MNASQTFNSVVFEKNYDTADGSRRSSNARGINIPDVLTLKSGPYTDSETKVSGEQFQTRVDLYDVDAITGQKCKLSAYVILQVPSIATTANVAVILATFRAAMAASGFLEDVLNHEN